MTVKGHKRGCVNDFSLCIAHIYSMCKHTTLQMHSDIAVAPTFMSELENIGSKRSSGSWTLCQSQRPTSTAVCCIYLAVMLLLIVLNPNMFKLFTIAGSNGAYTEKVPLYIDSTRRTSFMCGPLCRPIVMNASFNVTQ